ncbi:hypothetical protein [Bradyrhizobium sp. CCBAU 53338]|uniref:hypothetical protein n=1 Tax=Bradyrhizobium sp. CCBAU 53338 TaxID=1325111 RepID=UPI00188BC68D|nr:hypothetical protein [Bradyrhizobium sp. CCBAU 53338]QOZ51571.1 hypothetical protein XH90_09390 [Bradyrhizobium sp. CCBAU 53338]
MAGRPQKTAWITEARRFRSALEAAGEGKREASLEELAGDDADVNTLRRAIRAVDLLDRWSQDHAEASEKLIATPQTALEVFAAWASLDEKAAWQAYEKWEQERTPINDLAQELRTFRSGRGARGGRGREKDLREQIAPHLSSFLRKLLGRNLAFECVRNVALMEESMMDFVASASMPEDSQSLSIAIVVVGPYRNPNMYRKRKIEWIQRAFSLAWIHDHVILVLEDAEEVAGYEIWVRKFSAEIRAGLRPSVLVAAAPTG